MPTTIRQIDPEALEQAASILREDGLVAFPTETVYGLGANALSPTAVQRIFNAKGRPATNPLIVHVATIEQAQELVTEWPEEAEVLARRFWPGPLTIVLPRHEIVPDLVTANGPTVGIRIPSHPTALALLEKVEMPIAAPSANRSNQLSPTTAQHVLNGLSDRVSLILDGGPCKVGVESTVLSLNPLQLLRPGGVTPLEIEAVLGPIQRQSEESDEPKKSPGLMSRHYSPHTPLMLSKESNRLVNSLLNQGKSVGWLTFLKPTLRPDLLVAYLPHDPIELAAALYETLHLMDESDLDVIVVDAPPEGDEWLAIRDRLQRASST